MFLFSPQGVFVIVVIALLLFGPEKLPEAGRIIGRFMAEFKRAQESVEATIRAEMYKSDGGVAPPATPVGSAMPASIEDEQEEDEE